MARVGADTAMEPNVQIVLGPVVNTWGPFRLRTHSMVYRDGRYVLLPDYVISIALERNNELNFARLSRSEETLSSLVMVVRRRMRELEHDLAYWDEHLRELQHPEQMAELQAHLDAEVRLRKENDNEEWANTATQVLANQQDERRQLYALYKAIQAGLSELEAEYPEIATDRDKSDSSER